MPILPSIRPTLISTLILATPLATTARADDDTVTLSANAAIVSDYRFRGVSLSDKDFAIQGGFDLATKSGFYLGTWGSSIENYEGSEFELDLYGGYATSFDNLNFDIGILAYTYPGSDDADTTYWEAYTSLGGSAGALDWTLGAAYAFDQDSIGGDDNIYLYLDSSLPLANSPVSLAGHIGFEDGAFGNEKWDWTLGLSYDFQQFTLGASYVDTNIDGRTSEGGVIVSLSAAF